MQRQHGRQRLGEELAPRAPALNLRKKRQPDVLYLRVGSAEERHDLDPVGVGARLGGHPPEEALFEEHAYVLGGRIGTPVARRACGHDVDGVRGLQPLVRPFVPSLQ